MITADEFKEICELTCPHCRNGLKPTFRESTNEWQHHTAKDNFMSFSICWASGLRKSEKYNPELAHG